MERTTVEYLSSGDQNRGSFTMYWWCSSKMFSLCPSVLLFNYFSSLDPCGAINNHLVPSCTCCLGRGLHRGISCLWFTLIFVYIYLSSLSTQIHVNMCADTHTHSVMVPDHLLWITGKEVLYKSRPASIKEPDRRKEYPLISSSLYSNILWQNCAYETDEHLGILNCLKWEFKNLLGSWVTPVELFKKGKLKTLINV